MNDIAKALGELMEMLVAGKEMEAAVTGSAKSHFRVMRANAALAFITEHGPTLAALVADGERYMWLRSQSSDDFLFAVVKNPHFDVYETPESLDAAIDAARAGGG